MAAFVIHTPPGIDETDMERATGFGPSMVACEMPLGELMRAAGFVDVVLEDVTVSFEASCDAILAFRDEHERQLRVEEGDQLFDDQYRKKRNMREGIRLGLMKRTLVVGTAAQNG